MRVEGAVIKMEKHAIGNGTRAVDVLFFCPHFLDHCSPSAVNAYRLHFECVNFLKTNEFAE